MKRCSPTYPAAGTPEYERVRRLAAPSPQLADEPPRRTDAPTAPPARTGLDLIDRAAVARGLLDPEDATRSDSAEQSVADAPRDLIDRAAEAFLGPAPIPQRTA